jgi:hypothetical protein
MVPKGIWTSCLSTVPVCCAVLMIVASAAEAQESPPAQTGPAQTGSIEEVLVTAEKRSAERLQDVPVPMTVLDANTLAENDQNRLQDYFATVPGFNLSYLGAGSIDALDSRSQHWYRHHSFGRCNDRRRALRGEHILGFWPGSVPRHRSG